MDGRRFLRTRSRASTAASPTARRPPPPRAAPPPAAKRSRGGGGGGGSRQDGALVARVVALARGGRTLAEIDTALNLAGFTNTRGKRWPARTDGKVLTRILSAAGVAAGAVADAPAPTEAAGSGDGGGLSFGGGGGGRAVGRRDGG